jgi:hypothetical protein
MVEIGNGAGQPQDPVIAPRGQAEALGGGQQHGLGPRIRCRDLVQKRAFGIGVDAGLGAEFSKRRPAARAHRRPGPRSAEVSPPGAISRSR